MSARAAVLVAALAALSGCAHPGGLAARPADPVALRKQVAATLLTQHAWAAATEPLRTLEAERPRDADVHVMLGACYREQGEYDQAEQQYRTALRLDGKRADAWGGLGLTRELRGDPGDGPLDDLRKAIALRPDVAAHHNNLGFALYLRGRDLDAVEAYRKGLARDPGAARLRNNLGFAYGRLGQWNLAKREFERGGTKAEADNNLGYVYEKAGDLDAACERYREAAAAAPAPAAVQANLTRACGALAAQQAAAAAAPSERTSTGRKSP